MLANLIAPGYLQEPPIIPQLPQLPLDEKFILKFIARKVSYLKYEKFSNNNFVIRNKKLESLKDFVKNEIESEKVITFEKLKEKIFQKTKINLENNFLEKIILKNLA